MMRFNAGHPGYTYFAGSTYFGGSVRDLRSGKPELTIYRFLEEWTALLGSDSAEENASLQKVAYALQGSANAGVEALFRAISNEPKCFLKAVLISPDPRAQDACLLGMTRNVYMVEHHPEKVLEARLHLVRLPQDKTDALITAFEFCNGQGADRATRARLFGEAIARLQQWRRELSAEQLSRIIPLKDAFTLQE